ncbi:hypothetical protein E2C01_046754 [Portunus trituberculatus]|uniref:Uncharacterized protein n=1 Tax=Portunus trituberculatus TaxID=210409 RepID=A0A5B7G5X6_PORTR|nr:hypothetical protein [Portunus trituberculatus]
MSWLPTATKTSASSGIAKSFWKRATYSTNSSGWHHLPSSNRSPVPGKSTSSLITVAEVQYMLMNCKYSTSMSGS